MGLLESFLTITERNQDRIFIIDAINDRSYTFGEFQNISLSLVTILKGHGITKGDRVAVLLSNSVEFVVVYFACLYMGAIVVPINIFSHSKNVTYIIEASNIKVAVYSPDTFELFKSILNIRPDIFTICFFPEPTKSESCPGSLNLRMDYFDKENQGISTPFEGVEADNIFTITFTSGTSANPKGVFHSIGDYIKAAKLFNERLNVANGDRFYHIFPMSYMAGLLNLIISPFMAGASIVVCSAFNPSLAMRFWKIPIKYKINRLWLTPSMVVMLMKIDRDEEGLNYCRNNIKDAFVGTAPFPTKPKHEFEEKYRISLYESYGLTETMFVTTNCPHYPIKDGSVGRSLEGIFLRVINERNEDLLYGTEGEIWVKTPTLMTGYLNELTSEPYLLEPDEWFPTGDIGYLDKDGDLYLTDRKKDIIIKAGVNISTRAIEETLLEHPAIEQVAVVGLPHEFYGEEVAAAVVLKPEEVMKSVLPSIKKLCQDNLDTNSRPAFFYEVDELPSGLTGKIQKRKVRELLMDRLEGN